MNTVKGYTCLTTFSATILDLQWNPKFFNLQEKLVQKISLKLTGNRVIET